MKAAVGEFSLAALLAVVGMLLAIALSGYTKVGGLMCIAAAAGLGYLGHKRGLADINSLRRETELNHELKLAQLQHEEHADDAAHAERLAELAARERVTLEASRRAEITEVAAEIKKSGHAVAHWKVRPGHQRQASPVPEGVDPLDYLIYRHTRSAEQPPNDPSLPAVRHFVDLRDAALVPEDRALMVDLLCSQIQSFDDKNIYTGILIPLLGNVVLGLAVADRLGLPPVLVREEPLFMRTTESTLQGGFLLLVDDIWSRAGILRRAVEMARFDNFSVVDGTLLFARAEGDVVEEMNESHVVLRPRAILGDADIDDIIARVSSATE
jgi:adenine/guanine phosphoribosyltransferase-like PRPP-binding protein